TVPLMAAVAETALGTDAPSGSVSFIAADGLKRELNFARIPGTQSRLVVSIDEARVTAAINREIRTAYIQLAFVCLFVVRGALVGAEKVTSDPIETMPGRARRFGEGATSARVAHHRLPAESLPLARAFNAMAARLGQREREMLANNDRLTVMAS